MLDRYLFFTLTIIFVSSFTTGSHANPLSIFTCPAKNAGSVVVERNENGHYSLVHSPFNTDNPIGELPLDLLTAALCKAQGLSLFLFAPKERDFISCQPGHSKTIEELSLFWQAKGYCMSQVGKTLFIYGSEESLLHALKMYSAHCESSSARGDLLCADLSLLPSNIPSMRLTVINLCKVEANQAICCLRRTSTKSQITALFQKAR